MKWSYYKVWVSSPLRNIKGEFIRWTPPRIWASFALQEDAFMFADQTRKKHETWLTAVMDDGRRMPHPKTNPDDLMR